MGSQEGFTLHLAFARQRDNVQINQPEPLIFTLFIIIRSNYASGMLLLACV